MKKINTKGFTLIELLAVITIMGVLMMVAIPSVSRTIENSRRDTFANVAKEYVNAVRNAILADEIECGGITASATETGTYYMLLNSAEDETKDLMESGGTSPWGKLEVQGYVKWVKLVEDDNYKTTYYISLRDTGKHGTSSELEEKEITRSKISTSAGEPDESFTGTGTECELK